jgi:hypothetical protein
MAQRLTSGSPSGTSVVSLVIRWADLRIRYSQARYLTCTDVPGGRRVVASSAADFEARLQTQEVAERSYRDAAEEKNAGQARVGLVAEQQIGLFRAPSGPRSRS